MNFRQESAVIAAGAMAAMIGAGLVFKGFEVQRQKRNQSLCLSQLKQIGLGTMQYVRDYDEQFPRAQNWATALLPYTKSTALFQCPQRGAAPQGYAFYRGAAGISQAAFDDPKINILYFDSDAPGFNACDNGQSLPRFKRHPSGFGIGFADGHVKMQLRPDFRAGYDNAFLTRQQQARAANAKFWASYQKKQRNLQLQKIARQKKSKTP